jgi:hypothetical protein
VSGDLHKLLDPFFGVQGCGLNFLVGWLRLFSEPMSGPSDEVGQEGGELLLQNQSGGGAHFETMHLKDAFAFFDAGFNGLAAIVSVKPGGSVFGDRFGSIMQKG